MTTEKFHNILLNLQMIINGMIASILICMLINVSNTNKCLNKVNEKVGADIYCRTNYLGLVKCNLK